MRITAAEVADYTFCRTAWWHSRPRHEKLIQRAEGQLKHAETAKRVGTLRTMEKHATARLMIAIAATLVSAMIFLIADFAWFRGPVSFYLELCGVVIALLSGGILLWHRSLARQAETLAAQLGDMADAFALDARKPPVFHNPALDLVGIPDGLIHENDEVIPIEFKTSEAPRGGPYRGHVLQLVAYAELVGIDGRAAPRGILQYADKSFPIEITDARRAELKATLRRMESDFLDQNLTPNHANPAKCGNCSHREVCSKRIH